METVLKTIITHESKLARRNWLFYLFILGVLGFMVGFLIPWNARSLQWWQVALASSFPAYGVCFLNLFQSLVITFLVCDIQRKRKKAETREVLFTRPVGNGEVFLGEILGILIPFFVIDVVFMISCGVIHLVIPDSPVNPGVYLFYLLVRVMPTLVFITGLASLVNRLTKSPFISWIILVGWLYFSYAYLTKPLHGMLDFWGSSLSGSFSTLVGFIDIDETLLHRGAFLLLGVCLLCFAAPLTKRLPGKPGRKFYFAAAASLFLVFSVGLGFIYLGKFQDRKENRNAYRETFAEYNKYPTVRILAHDITYHPGGDRFSATSRMEVQNQRKVKMERFLLFLNPGLEIDKLESNGLNIPWHREHQVVVIERSLEPGERVDVTMEYAGGIDEDVYQVNLPDEEFFSPVSYTMHIENLGSRLAFVSGDFTLLVPEAMWYPMAVSPGGLMASKEMNFTRYTLRVKQPGDKVVLSQGKTSGDGEYVTFENRQNLTGISLCIGEFEKRAVTVDSLTVELYTYLGNDFYMKSIDEHKPLQKGAPGRELRIERIFRSCKDIIENNQDYPYPYKYLKLIEAPASFLHYNGSLLFRDNAQPEIVFFNERWPREVEKPGGDWEKLLLDKFPSALQSTGIGKVFSGYTRSVTSDKFRGMDRLYRQMMNPLSQRFTVRPYMLKHIEKNGLEGCIMEEYSPEQEVAISLKVYHLLSYLTTITPWDSLSRFMEEFNTRTYFREVNFDSFIDGFEQHFGENIRDYMDKWYTGREIPRLYIKDQFYSIVDTLQILDFKVGNFSETDGIVSVISYRDDDLGRKQVYRWQGYPVKPGECKRIVVHEELKYGLTLTTNFSGNLPGNFPFQHNQAIKSVTVPEEGVTPLERDEFNPPGEIIVDNEDENFHLINSPEERKQLADYLTRKNDEDEYYWGICNTKINTWGAPTIPTALNNNYGKYIRSAYTKKAGTGEFKAEWVAELPEAGRYEIFIYRPHVGRFTTSENETFLADYPGMKNYYTVYTPEGEEEVVLEVEKDDPAWVSLGIFTLPAGTSRVVLDDRGASPITIDNQGAAYVQLVVADAVKWVKIK